MSGAPDPAAPAVPGITGPLRALRAEARSLPVAPAVPALLDALRTRGCAVLAAPPGTGKTTLVPLLIAEATGGRVLVAEPRRMAARAAARRMAWLLGERVGETVGFTVRGSGRSRPAPPSRWSPPVCCCNACNGTPNWPVWAR